jgi:hypothetical protein
MKMFVIEAYGGRQSTDGPIARFTVHAESIDEAINLVRHSTLGGRFDHFDVMEESPEFESDTAEIISASEGPYERTP